MLYFVHRYCYTRLCDRSPRPLSLSTYPRINCRESLRKVFNWAIVTLRSTEDVKQTKDDSRDEDRRTNREKEEIDVPKDEYDKRDLEQLVHRIRLHVPSVSMQGLLHLCLLPGLAVTLKDNPVTPNLLLDENRDENREKTKDKASEPVKNGPPQAGTRWGEDWIGGGRNGNWRRDEGIPLRCAR